MHGTKSKADRLVATMISIQICRCRGYPRDVLFPVTAYRGRLPHVSPTRKDVAHGFPQPVLGEHSTTARTGREFSREDLAGTGEVRRSTKVARQSNLKFAF